MGGEEEALLKSGDGLSPTMKIHMCEECKVENKFIVQISCSVSC